MEFFGYERPDGSAGIRNHVAVISSGRCGNEMAVTIADAVQGAVPVIHTHECVRLKDDNEKALRVIAGMGSNPNVAAAIVVGIGCENPSPGKIGEEIAKSKKPVEVLTVMESNGYQDLMDRALAIVRRMVAEASQLQRKPFPLSYLTLGVKCGGSAAVSGIAGNSVTGKVLDRLIAEGGTAIFSETTEVIGADHLIEKRAVNKEVARRFREMVDRQEARIRATGEDIKGTQPTRGNIAEGLTTIEEKSLGSIMKGGSKTLQGVLDYGEIPEGKGLFFMDGPGRTPEALTGLNATGAQIIIFPTGGGSPGGSLISPVIKVTGNPQTAQRLKDHIDVDVSSLIRGKELLEKAGGKIFQRLLKVANGELTKSETLGYGSIAVWNIGLLCG